ncbi:MAG: ABC transporter permease [Anaerolineae bacterium]|nr:ABC transporter permease [Anaerolineae bacterium]
MGGAVFRRTLGDSWRGILGWGLALAALAFIVISFYPTISMFPELSNIIESMPPFMKAMVGDIEDFTSPEGFLATKLFTSMPIILAVYGIISGVAAVAGEENRGTMDLLMSAPVARWRVILEKFAAFVVSVLGILAIMYVGVVVGVLVTAEIETPPGRLLEATLNLVPITLTFGAFTFFLSAALPSRMPAGPIAAAVVVATYAIYLFGELSSVVASVQWISPFYYYGNSTLIDGVVWGKVVVLVVVSAVLVLLSMVSFERRDLTV